MKRFMMKVYHLLLSERPRITYCNTEFRVDLPLFQGLNIVLLELCKVFYMRLENSCGYSVCILWRPMSILLNLYYHTYLKFKSVHASDYSKSESCCRNKMVNKKTTLAVDPEFNKTLDQSREPVASSYLNFKLKRNIAHTCLAIMYVREGNNQTSITLIRNV